MVFNKNVFIAALAVISGVATAQFDGPAPLAWRWQQSSSASPNGSPLVDGNTFYYNLGSRVYAVDVETGNTLWKYPNVEPLPGTLRRTPVLSNGVLYVFCNDEKFYAINAATGQLKWVLETGANVFQQPVVIGKFVVIPFSNGFNIADADTGKFIYESPIKIKSGITSPVVPAGDANFALFTNDGELIAFSPATGKKVWGLELPSRTAVSSLVNANNNLYFYVGNVLGCVSATNGSRRWQYRFDENQSYLPVVGPDAVASISQNGKVTFLDQKGKLMNRTQLDLGSQPSIQPAAVGSKFLVATSNGAINLIDPFQLTPLWQYFVRPMNDQAATPVTGTGGAAGAGGGRAGGGGGLGDGGGGGSAMGGLGGPGGMGGGMAGGGQAQSNAPIVTVPVSSRPVLAGKTLLVPAVDGSILAFDAEKGVDLTGPEVTQIWPRRGELISGLSGQEFEFKIDDDASGVNASSIKVDVDGTVVKTDFGREGVLSYRISQTLKNNSLSDGRHVITVYVKDWMGNETKKQFQIKIDNALKVQRRDDNNKTPGGPGGGGRAGGLGGAGGGGGLGGG